MGSKNAVHRREGGRLVLVLERRNLRSQAGWTWLAMAMIAAIAGGLLWQFSAPPQNMLALAGPGLALLAALCGLRAAIHFSRRMELVCDRDAQMASCYTGHGRRMNPAPQWRRALGERVSCTPIAAPEHSKWRGYWWVRVCSTEAPTLILEGRWSESAARSVTAALESYLGAMDLDVDENPGPCPIDAPKFPADSALYCYLAGDAFIVELPRRAPVKGLIAAVALGGLFLWAYAGYLFQGPFDVAWEEGEFGTIALVTALFAAVPLLFIGLLLAHAAKSRDELVLEGPYIVYRQLGLLGTREIILHRGAIACVERGMETLGGNSEILRIRHHHGILECARHLSETDLQWLEEILSLRLAGASLKDLAEESRATSHALVLRSSPGAALSPVVHRIRDHGEKPPEPPRPPAIVATLNSDEESLSIEAPARGFTIVHAGLVGASLAAGILLGGYWLLALIPVTLAVLHDATRRTRLVAGPEGVSVETRWKLGSRIWHASNETLHDMELRRATLRPSALLAGEGYVLRAKTSESEADFGHGLSRKELAWLRDRAIRAAAWGPHAVNALDTLAIDSDATGQTLPPKGPLNTAEYLSHTLGRAMDSSRYFVLEFDAAPVEHGDQDARKLADLTILGTFAAALIPLGGYGVYLGLIEPSAASLYRIPLGAGLIALMPTVLLASLYRDVLIVDRAGRLAVQARTLLLPPSLLPAALVQYSARRGQVHDLDSFEGVGLAREEDESGEAFYTVRFEGATPLIVKRQRSRDAAQAYGQALARFAGLQFAEGDT